MSSTAEGEKDKPEDLELVSLPKSLTHALVKGSGDGKAQIDMAAIERAEKALAKLSVSFNMWMEDDVCVLREAHERARAEGLQGEPRDLLFRAAHDLRGEAHTLGFPLVGQVAASLGDLLSMTPENVDIPAALVEGHVLAIIAMIREDARGGDNKTAIALANCLREASHKMLEASGALEEPELQPGSSASAA